MIDIVMATYNGSKFLENQILSLLQQTYKDWKLIIHDDGSVDSTIEIIDKYIKQDKRISLIQDNKKGLKSGKNFLHTLQYSTSEYVIFCDQDDIWLENKLKELMGLMSVSDKSDIPILVYCDGYALDEFGVIHQESISNTHANSIQDFIIYNSGYQGCSMLINRKLIDMVNNYKGYIYHHDDIVTLFAYSFGDVYFLPKQLMLYRQHENAVTGNKDFTRSKYKRIFKNVGFVVSKEHYLVKKSFHELYKYDVDSNVDNVFKAYLNYCDSSSFLSRLLIVLFTPLTYGGSKLKLLAKTLLQRLFDK